MCGRFLITDPDEALRRLFGYDGPATGLVANYNVAPTTVLATVRRGVETPFLLSKMRWGLIPSWAKDAAIGSKLINARAETVAEKPSFRSAFRQRRCLIPAHGFYEWKGPAAGQGNGPKQPYLIGFEDRRPFAFAGLWERWQPPAGADAQAKGGSEGEDAAAPRPVTSFTIVTTEAAPEIADIHHRMPVIVAPEDHAAWLDAGDSDPSAAQALLRPWQRGGLTAWPVALRVNNVRNNDPSLAEPAPI